MIGYRSRCSHGLGLGRLGSRLYMDWVGAGSVSGLDGFPRQARDRRSSKNSLQQRSLRPRWRRRLASEALLMRWLMRSTGSDTDPSPRPPDIFVIKRG